jgi:hypothetical protein
MVVFIQPKKSLLSVVLIIALQLLRES